MLARMARLVQLLAAVAALAVAVPALAATKHGVTPLSPKPNASIAAGSKVTFKARAKGGGTVWLHVCKSKRRRADGTICSSSHIRQMRKKDGVYRTTPTRYTFPSYWLNTPGSYYWQVHRIKCEGSTSDCRQEGPVLKLRIR
jgi:hypothetical protein